MAIDFSFSAEVEAVRHRVKFFMRDVVAPRWAQVEDAKGDRKELISAILELRPQAQEQGLWMPHMPQEWGGMGLTPTALAAVSAEAAKVSIGPYIMNCQAPDEGNMHTLLHFGTEAQKETYLRPLCEGTIRSCFSMTEPEVAGSDPTLLQTSAVRDGDDWVINGRKWFTSGAKGAKFAIVIAKTDPDAEIPQARNTAFIVILTPPGLNW